MARARNLGTGGGGTNRRSPPGRRRWNGVVSPPFSAVVDRRRRNRRRSPLPVDEGGLNCCLGLEKVVEDGPFGSAIGFSYILALGIMTLFLKFFIYFLIILFISS